MSQVPAAPVHRHRVRTFVVWVVVVIAVILVVCAAWIAVRAFAAKADLEASTGLVGQLKTQVARGDLSGARRSTATLAAKAESARILTSDPIWRAGELVPFLGPNLRAVRGVTAIVSDVVDRAITPLAGVAGSLGPAAFTPVHGAIPLKPIAEAAPVLTRADTVVHEGLDRARRIQSSSIVGPLRSVVTRLVKALQSAGETTDAAARAARLAPGMLGQDGPRDYLLMFQNNAELRSTGGIPGALALVRVDDGTVKLIRQSAAADFVHTAKSTLPVPAATAALYGTITGQFMQDVNLTPRFEISASLAVQMWQRKYGGTIDGVVSLDPVALSRILAATGPVRLPTGDELTSDNAVRMLLSTTYARFPAPAAQDAFFASAAAAVFAKVSGGSFDPAAMIGALAAEGSAHRLLIWSAHADEERQLAQSTLAGVLPTGSAAARHLGVYLNDATGAKMDYYLHTAVGIGHAICRADGRATYAVEITLRSAAPATAATTLPEYVTGGGHRGTKPGNVKTNVVVYVPRGATVLGVLSGGAPILSASGNDDGYAVRTFQVELEPGQTKSVQLQFLAVKGAAAPEPVTTPGVYPTPVSRIPFGCASALK